MLEPKGAKGEVALLKSCEGCSILCYHNKEPTRDWVLASAAALESTRGIKGNAGAGDKAVSILDRPTFRKCMAHSSLS